jgi:hypothetical protein
MRRDREFGQWFTPWLRAASAERALVLVPVVASAVFYFPVARNFFRGDDFLNLYYAENWGLGRFLVTVHAGHALVARNLIWWVLYEVAGPRPEVFFVTCVLTHLAVVGLLFEAIRRLTGSAPVACVAASLWGTAPVHDEAIGWFSVYGQLLASAIVAWMLVRLAHLRDGGSFGPGAAIGWALLVFVIMTSFGVGLGIALGLPVVAYVLLPPSSTRRRVVTTLALAAALCPLVYWSLIQLHHAVHGSFLPPGVIGVSLRYPATVLQLLGLLAGNGVVTLHAAPAASHIEQLGPVWWGLVAAWLVVVPIAFFHSPPADRRVILAALVLALTCYGPIAAGRAPFFRKGIRFEREARYQYGGTLALTLVAAVVLSQLSGKLPTRSGVRLIALVAFAGGLVVCGRRFAPPLTHHEGGRRETEAVLAAIRAQIDAAPPGSAVYIQNRQFLSVGLLLRKMTIFPGWAGVFTIFFPDNTVDGRRVYFVSDEAVVAAGRRGRRTASLLVPSAPAAPAAAVGSGERGWPVLGGPYRRVGSR